MLEVLKDIYQLKQDYDAISIVTMSALPEWHKIGGANRSHLDIVAMGYAAPTGLGVALARPERKVIVIDGDGSLLMELGCLATIARYHPKNFYHFIMNNGVYASTGGQKISTVNWKKLIESFGIITTRDNWVPKYLPLGPLASVIDSDQLSPVEYPELNIANQAHKLRSELNEVGGAQKL